METVAEFMPNFKATFLLVIFNYVNEYLCAHECKSPQTLEESVRVSGVIGGGKT